MRIVGCLMTGLIFVVLFIGCAKDIGLKNALSVFGFIFGLLIWIGLACYFMVFGG